MDGMGYMLSSLRMWMDSSSPARAFFEHWETFCWISSRPDFEFHSFVHSMLPISKKASKLKNYMLILHPSSFHILYVHPQSKPIPSMGQVSLPTIWLIFMLHLVDKIYEFPWMVWETFWFHPNPRGRVAQILFTPSLCVASRADGRGRAGGTESLFGSDDHQTLRWRLGGNMNERFGSSNSHPLWGESHGLVFGKCFWCDSRWALKDSDEQKSPPCNSPRPIISSFGAPQTWSLRRWPGERPRLNGFLHKVGALHLSIQWYATQNVVCPDL